MALHRPSFRSFAMRAWTPFAAAAVCLSILLALGSSVAAHSTGEPGSEARRNWCEAERQKCFKAISHPAYIGPPAKQCEIGDPYCDNVCERLWGRQSDCLSRFIKQEN
jgi:hypothetical protein